MSESIRRWEREHAFKTVLFLHCLVGAFANVAFFASWLTYWLPPGEGARGMGPRVLLDPWVGVALLPAGLFATGVAYFAGRFFLRRADLSRTTVYVHGAVTGVIAAGTPVLQMAVIPLAFVALIVSMLLCWLHTRHHARPT